MNRRSYARSKPPIPKSFKPLAPIPVAPTQIEWKEFRWGKVGWCPTSRSYSVEILGGSAGASGIKQRGDVVQWLLEHGIHWDPARETRMR